MLWFLLMPVWSVAAGATTESAGSDPGLAAALALDEQAREVDQTPFPESPAGNGEADLLRLLDLAEEGMRAAVARSSGGQRALSELVAFYDHWIERAEWTRAGGAVEAGLASRSLDYARRLLVLVRSPDLSADIWRDLEQRTLFQSRPAVLALWLDEEPRDSLLLAALGESLQDERLRAAAFGAALMRAEADRVPVRTTAWMVQERVKALLELGLAETALAELERHPAPVRRLLLGSGSGPVEVSVGSLPVEAALRDLRLELAGAHLLAGEAREATSLVAGLPPRTDSLAAPEPGPFDSGARAVRFQREIVERLLALSGGSPGEDPFGILVEALGIEEHRLQLTGGLSVRLAELLAEEAGYRGISGVLGAELCRWSLAEVSWELRRIEPFTELPAAVQAEWEALGALLATERARRATRLRGLEPEEPWIRPASCAPVRAATEEEPPSWLHRVPSVTDAERLPGRFADSGDDAVWQPAPVTAGPHPGGAPPPGLHPVAYLRRGSRILAVGLTTSASQTWGSEYQVVLSPDEGVHWGWFHRLGLRLRDPFEIVVDSSHNDWIDDRLTLEAVFVGAASGIPEIQNRDRVLLTLDAGLVLRDGDEDSLTDFEEWEIGTDPDRADSDGDGIADDRDLLPQSSGGALGGSVPPEAFAAAVERILFGFRKGERAPIRLPSPRRLAAGDTVFLAVLGDGAPFDRSIPADDLEAPVRVSLVEPPTELGQRASVEIRLFELDWSRERAVVVWGWSRGIARQEEAGRFVMALRDGRWTIPIEIRGGGCVTSVILDSSPGEPEAFGTP